MTRNTEQTVDGLKESFGLTEADIWLDNEGVVRYKNDNICLLHLGYCAGYSDALWDIVRNNRKETDE